MSLSYALTKPKVVQIGHNFIQLDPNGPKLYTTCLKVSQMSYYYAELGPKSQISLKLTHYLPLTHPKSDIPSHLGLKFSHNQPSLSTWAYNLTIPSQKVYNFIKVIQIGLNYSQLRPNSSN